jgi:hypothetical protein
MRFLGSSLLIITFIVALVPPPAGVQGQEKKAMITGWPPYMFGADVNTIFQANSTLKRECVVNGQRTRERAGWLCAQGKVDAPIAGRNYSATLFLEFINDRLEMVVLMWTFDALMSRVNAKGALDGELRANYADEIRRGTQDAPLDFKKQFLGPLLNFRVDESAVSLTFWVDAQGNALMIVDAMGQPSLLLIYASAKGTGNTSPPPPPPPAKY